MITKVTHVSRCTTRWGKRCPLGSWIGHTGVLVPCCRAFSSSDRGPEVFRGGMKHNMFAFFSSNYQHGELTASPQVSPDHFPQIQSWMRRNSWSGSSFVFVLFFPPLLIQWDRSMTRADPEHAGEPFCICCICRGVYKCKGWSSNTLFSRLLQTILIAKSRVSNSIHRWVFIFLISPLN